MACQPFEEHRIAFVYEEIASEDREKLERHLSSCESCRREIEQLAATRARLRSAAPEIPSSPRVVVLGSRRTAAVGWGTFAAGFACAALLFGVAAVAGWSFGMRGTMRDGTSEGDLAAAGIDVVDRETLDREMETQMVRLRRLLDEREQRSLRAPSSDADPTTIPTAADPRIDDIGNRLASFQQSWERQRRDDLQFVLSEILASEVRSGTAIDETQQALRYIALAGNPQTSEW